MSSVYSQRTQARRPRIEQMSTRCGLVTTTSSLGTDRVAQYIQKTASHAAISWIPVAASMSRTLCVYTASHQPWSTNRVSLLVVRSCLKPPVSRLGHCLQYSAYGKDTAGSSPPLDRRAQTGHSTAEARHCRSEHVPTTMQPPVVLM